MFTRYHCGCLHRTALRCDWLKPSVNLSDYDPPHCLAPLRPLLTVISARFPQLGSAAVIRVGGNVPRLLSLYGRLFLSRRAPPILISRG